jgi:hypothetical protein
VLWPNKAADVLLRAGDVDAASAQQVHRVLAASFPPA